MVTSLSNKYRPKTLDEVCSQKTAVAIIQKMCESPELSNRNFLFTGPAGTGKTTISRIIAKTLNGNTEGIIEVDAASKSGVDDVRDLIQEASQYPMGSKYKVIICDECFPANALVSTPSGLVSISALSTGDTVYSMSGSNVVTHIFKSSVLTTRLCCVTVNSHRIITTKDHLFFTKNGWIPAAELVAGDIVYGTEDLSELWEVISESSQECEVLLSSLCSGVSESSSHSEDESGCLSSMQKTVSSEELLTSENLLKTLYEASHFEVKYNDFQFCIRYGVTETVIRTNVSEQSDELCRNYTKDATDQTDQWNTPSVVRCTRWQWEIYDTADSVVGCIRRWLDTRTTDSNTPRSENYGVSYLLQTRPWLSINETCSRGGWQNPQFEKAIIEGLEKRGISSGKRVDSVEVYQRGNNDELFRSSFSDTELSQEYVTMYDLEVSGHPSYFVNDTLVHNCHAFSNSAWQALLKCLEEQVGSTVWIFCTTNPEKIPATITSRVQLFKLSKIDVKTIQARLKFILDAEIAEGRAITYSEDALAYIAKLSNGGMRDAITSLDKCLAFDNNITSELLEKALDLPNYDDYFNLLNALVKKDNIGITNTIDTVYNSGTNFVKWFEGFHSFLCNIVKYVMLKDISRTMIPFHYQEKLQKYNEQHAFVCLKLANLVMAMNKELKFTQYLQETAITYLCSPVMPKKEG